MNNMTAVEWLIDELTHNGIEYLDLAYEIIEKAKEMEKEQIKKMFSDEEVLDLLAKFRRENRGKDFIPFKDIQEWFEQFKKDKK
jgi:hypothetical protein